jgi:hypothetical protein
MEKIKVKYAKELSSPPIHKERERVAICKALQRQLFIRDLEKAFLAFWPSTKHRATERLSNVNCGLP